MSIQENLRSIKSSLAKEVTLVAVSKTKPIDDIMEAYNAGQRIFGENKVQEMVKKWEQLPKDIQWHMIGHLQRNKVKYMAEFVDLVHGVDSLRLLKEINKNGAKHNRKIGCLLQMHIAEEDTKFGLDQEELNDLIASDEFQAMQYIEIRGLMGMATFTNNTDQIRKEFKFLKLCFEDLSKKLPQISILSMGMSGDYQLAMEEGSTMVRIGSSIFGARNYQ
ncbi:YggS family pyridoxal phosphate-dependent enzyme [Croceivirga thetidis]|uniref:Pyridoxal phosphate homeostasis protein n=1 Tax=Croceivirga thetidis TaxID=2721623 RepID=A0ABX1GUY1_9FLAO|nr:YggS family pyridoxal phosphate-dependent enzyme [Croceivirga thetidis]NKI32547.1 YggS family pyridoxal phosphate-dependent enzyme [Croceivirga thetidis]